MTTATATTQTPTSRALALAAAETRLVLRNRTVLVSSIVVPVGLGIFWAVTFIRQSGPAVLALQFAVALGMGVYVTATQTLVARRHTRVLKRLRTTGISDGGLLLATIAPSAVIGMGQILIFLVLDVVAGVPIATDPLALVLAVVAGLALVVTAALATAVITPLPERAQITTLPLTFVLLGAAIAMVFVPLEGWWQALAIVPGAAIGELARFAVDGGAWTAASGFPVILVPVLASIVWPVVFARFARTRFRWDPR